MRFLVCTLLLALVGVTFAQYRPALDRQFQPDPVLLNQMYDAYQSGLGVPQASRQYGWGGRSNMFGDGWTGNQGGHRWG